MITSAVMCLALNVYFEARSEPLEGQMAVARVTDTRAEGNPNNYCAVVWKYRQFSWTIDHNENEIDKKSREWKAAVAVAKTFKKFPDYTQGSTHFHANYVHPYWCDRMIKVAQIGAHIFYRDI